MVFFVKKVMERIGLSPERLRLEFISSSEGTLFVEAVNDFVRKVKELGPLGEGEGLEPSRLDLNLKAVTKLVPYIRLVLNERLRLQFATIEECQQFYSGEELERLFAELIADKLALSQIMLLLRERPLSSEEISGILGLTPSEISRHLNSSARHGLLRYEQNRWSVAPA
jgi:DNA-binding transcriptional ArsR family regulator